MKTIKMRIQKFSRPLVILLATVVAIITSIVVANATQTITTPNAASISYNLVTGASSAAITPVTNKPVLVMGCTTTFGQAKGVAHVSLEHIPSGGFEWTGLESPTSLSGGSTITSGFNNLAGTHIVYIDSSHSVAIQVASADTILIHNGTGGTVTCNVTLVW
jgi:hypothetical protein